jgi:hypothetical protein
MRALGVNFNQNDLRYVTLEKGSTEVSLISKDKLVYPKLDVPSLMEWFETQLNLLIDEHEPVKVGYKISLNLGTIKQIQQSCYPQAILNLIGKKRALPIFHWSSQGINATKFGEPNSTDVYSYVDSKLGAHPPYWDKPTKDALLTAWFCLLS